MAPNFPQPARRLKTRCWLIVFFPLFNWSHFWRESAWSALRRFPSPSFSFFPDYKIIEYFMKHLYFCHILVKLLLILCAFIFFGINSKHGAILLLLLSVHSQALDVLFWLQFYNFYWVKQSSVKWNSFVCLSLLTAPSSHSHTCVYMKNMT